MPRTSRKNKKRGNNTRNKRRGRSGANTGDFSSTPFSITNVFTFTASGAAQSIAIDVDAFASTTRLNILSQAWQYYKYTSLKFTVYPFSDTTHASNTFAFGYSPNSEDGTSGAYTTFAEVIQLVTSNIHSTVKTVPTVIRCSKNVLQANTQKMFPTSSGNTLDNEVQGVFTVCPLATSTSSVVVRIEGVLKFMIAQPQLGDDLIPKLVAPYQVEAITETNSPSTVVLKTLPMPLLSRGKGAGRKL
jgi:hypothetical protein